MPPSPSSRPVLVTIEAKGFRITLRPLAGLDQDEEPGFNGRAGGALRFSASPASGHYERVLPLRDDAFEHRTRPDRTAAAVRHYCVELTSPSLASGSLNCLQPGRVYGDAIAYARMPWGRRRNAADCDPNKIQQDFDDAGSMAALLPTPTLREQIARFLYKHKVARS